MCLAYPRTRWFIGREELQRLKKSVMPSMDEAREILHINKPVWDFNGQDNCYKFFNSSRIELLDLKMQPRDPMYERYGSLLYTGGWLEEAGETHFAAFDTLKSRINRWMNVEYKIAPKILITCNPKKNWLYTEFWKPWNTKTLKSDSIFIPALFSDNKYIAEDYGKSLASIKDEAKKQRLMYGNWEYSSDRSALLEYDDILNIFTNQYVFNPSEKLYLTCDVARFGRDKAVIILWQGWYIRKIWDYGICTTKELRQKLEKICTIYKIPRSYVVVDAGGVGGGVVDEFPGCKSFVDARTPILRKQDKLQKEQNKYDYEFGNLRAQATFYAADMIEKGKMGCYEDIDIKYKEDIIAELEQWKKRDIEKDEGKVFIIKKEDMKENLGGKSPDFGDNIKMRAFFDIVEVNFAWA